MGIIMSGKEIANEIKEEIKSYVNTTKKTLNKSPKIVSILVGNDGGSIYYQNFQQRLAEQLNIDFEKIILNETILEEDLISLIKKLNFDKNIDGIILLLPLPKHINEKIITNIISVEKDIDCLSEASVGRFYKGEKSFLPCTPNSVITLLKAYKVPLEGANVVIVGRSNIVGKPLFQMFLNENSTVTICHSKTKNLKKITQTADILVLAIGKPKFIDGEYIKEGAVIIDVGTSNVNGKITGDVDFEDVIEKAAMVTPVPGGVGALTTTLLFKNACEGLK
ncbi:tetrahydrofolate dehydrogenase/cyclohydrolase catalytic domain-containing protein [Clostridium tarantellae]|uniref:Bifunctional protein FolD n=1 Tax=Clostridium tarantellae TaxID=39493 RepID=A0A6I1MGU2_9CLOT|nr:tetrahydrofolate dehydrogenase/cyclohydrolase catalytic domain-containing protein [Clostridium tarantellae]MPQ42756.1 bifunctional methylenetetrahydrofolate dehydrogenase/methenyltetrahydrofolate cyclohydrolase [Clostridium tarantellae]